METATTKATLHDIAQLAGVSQGTVSKALNDVPTVNKATKKKIKEIAAALNYQFTPYLERQQHRKRSAVDRYESDREGKKITIYDIANALNLSPSTVSRALNGNKRINKNTVRRIIKFAKQVGYDYDAAASIIAKKSKSAIQDPSAHTTIYDIAQSLQISASTVSRALSSSNKVSEKTREKVKMAAQQMGFVVNHAASSLRTKRKNAIGIIMDDIRSGLSSELIRGIEEECSELGLRLVISNAGNNNELRFLSEEVDGLIVFPLQIELAEVFANSYHGIKPAVIIGANNKAKNSINVLINWESASFETFNSLISSGCRNIFYADCKDNAYDYFERLRGYKRALYQRQLNCSEELVMTYRKNEHMEASIAIATRIRSLPQFPDALFIADQRVAVALLAALKLPRKDLQQLHLAGLNYQPNFHTDQCQLSSLNYNEHEMGRFAARKIIDRVLGADKTRASTFYFKYMMAEELCKTATG
jgi:LacI family transcriptional regulator